MELINKPALLCGILCGYGPFATFRTKFHNSYRGKIKFLRIFKTGKIDKEYGKVYSQLFTWRQKGDYDDLFDFEKDKVVPYFEPVNQLISTIADIIQK